MRKVVWIALLLLFVVHVKAQEKTYRVFFAYNEYALPDSGLWDLVKGIHAPGLERVLIEGHCDSIGSVAYNQQLSERRATTLKQFLVANGIKDKQIKTCLGRGELKPLSLNGTEAERQLNRRVDITLYYSDRPLPSSEKTITPIPEKPKVNSPSKDSMLVIENVGVGEQIQLQNLYFIPGRHIIKSESYPELLRLLKTLLHYKTLTIEIQGHVCCAAEHEDGYDWDLESYNLSETRALAVAEFLIQGGINAKRLKVKGYGASQKISRDETEEAHRALNRRVVIKILSK